MLSHVGVLWHSVGWWLALAGAAAWIAALGLSWKLWQAAAARRFRQGEERHQALLENIPGAVIRCATEFPWRAHLMSAGVEGLTGYPASAFLSGQVHVGDLVVAEDLPGVVRTIKESVAAGNSFNVQCRIRCADGSLRWVESRGKAIPGPDGSPRWLDGVVVDVTDRVLAQKNLRESEFWLLESQRMARMGTFRVSLEDETWSGSEVLHDIMGVTADYPHTREGWFALVDPDDRRELGERSDATLSHAAPFDIEYRFHRHSDGRLVWVRSRGGVFHDGSGKPVFAGFVLDITAARNLQEQLLQTQKMESVGRLAGGVAHDFNNLLTVINGYSQMALSEIADNDFLADMIQQIQAAGERAATLTKQLLAFSRKQILQPRAVDINLLVAETERMLQRVIGEDIALRTVLAPGLPLIKADPGQLTQVLLNLAVNARDAMPSGGQVTIETTEVSLDAEYAETHADSESGRFVQLVISDNGQGMDAETQSHLFEPFFTTKAQGHGTGLGLSTVYGIIRQSGGWINVYSEPGMGTTFRIYLALAESEDTSVEAAAWIAGNRRLSATILLAEDQDAVRRFACLLLRRWGCQVLEASSGAEALALASSFAGPIDALLTDVVMPEMTGPRLAELLRAQRPGMRVLYMSGYTENVIAHHGVLGRDVVMLEKPFTAEALASKLEQVLVRAAGGDASAESGGG